MLTVIVSLPILAGRQEGVEDPWASFVSLAAVEECGAQLLSFVHVVLRLVAPKFL